MFAYCGNNPISRKDDTGTLWRVLVVAVVYAVAFCSCSSTSEFGAAEEYIATTDPHYNCYAYALGETKWRYVGGNPNAVDSFDVYVVANMVIADVEQSGRTIRPIESFDSPIESHEYRIALRTGENDYHFMRQNSDGTWSHKPGWMPSVLEDGNNPTVMSWDLPYITTNKYGKPQIGYITNYYDSETIYFAVSK